MDASNRIENAPVVRRDDTRLLEGVERRLAGWNVPEPREGPACIAHDLTPTTEVALMGDGHHTIVAVRHRCRVTAPEFTPRTNSEQRTEYEMLPFLGGQHREAEAIDLEAQLDVL